MDEKVQSAMLIQRTFCLMQRVSHHNLPICVTLVFIRSSGFVNGKKKEANKEQGISYTVLTELQLDGNEM